MARMTASDFITLGRASLGGETSETLTDAAILRFANQSALEITARYRLPELVTTTTVTTSDGTYEYSIGSDNLYVIEVIDTTNNSDLIKFSRKNFEEYFLGDLTNITGTPTHYVIDSNSSGVQRISFYPVPDGTYSIRVVYYQQPTEIVSSPTATSFTELHPAWDTVILDMTISKGWKYLGDIEKSRFYMSEAKSSSVAALKTSIYSSDVPTSFSSPVGREVS